YHTPWGRAINFDDAYSDDVKHFFIQNALHWFQHFHIDALRLDAIQTIYDMGAKHFLRELAEIVDEFSGRIGRKFYLIAESDLNDRRIVLERQREGFGIDSQWSDDFHHAVHARLTGETQGYYQDFGSTEKIARALKNGFVLDGRFSDFRKRTHGSFSQDMPSQRFVVCVQNHDQVGNRFKSDRLSSLLSFEALKLAAAVLITAPYVPLVFMGEEYAEEAPFNYFVDFKDEGLIRAVREGRRREFAAFGWKNEPLDPFAADTFLHSKLHWDKRREGRHAVLLSFYKRLFELRKTVPALKALDREGMTVAILEDVIMVKRLWADSCILILMNFGKARADINSGEDFQMGDRILDSCEAQWLGKGTSLPQRLLPSTVLTLNPLSFALYQEI
ncbi:MAG: DUF3459 domain-containing protein, partial [Candidatus Omnitrophica bacterium]|nr:DUF3459 domain-containing protein [Candidatus Omnitrophota bacterium]